MSYTKAGTWQNNITPPAINATNLANIETGIYAAHTEDTIAALKALSTSTLSTGVVRHVLGYYAAGDGGGGMFRWDATSAVADNGGTVIRPSSNPSTGRWVRVYSGALNAAWFGLKGDDTTDDTTQLQAAIQAAAGKELYVPPAPSKYKITAALTVPANTHIRLHPRAIVRQVTIFTPAFDLLDTSDVTIEGGYFRFEGDRTYVSNPSIRDTGPICYAAAVWTNSPRTTVRNMRVYGFQGPAVSLAGWNTSLSAHQDYYVPDCAIENLLVDTVTWGVLAYGFDGLTIKNISGHPVSAPTGFYNTGGQHVVYITAGGGSNVDVHSRGLDLHNAYGHDMTDTDQHGRAFVFKKVRGATVGRLQANNCYGAVSFEDCSDLTIDEIVTTNDLGDSATNGSIQFTDNLSSYVRIHSASLDFSAGNIACKMDGSHNEIGSLSVNANRSGSTGVAEVWISGSNNVINSFRYRNKGAGGERALYFIGTDCSARNVDIAGAQYGVLLDASSVRAVLEYDPDLISASAGKIFDFGATNPRLRPRRNSVVLGSDVANSTTSYADVTGFSFAVTSGVTYRFQAKIHFDAAAATTGAQWSINGPTTTRLAYAARWIAGGATSGVSSTEKFYYANVYNAGTAAAVTNGLTTGNFALIEGTIIPSANGTVIVRFASSTTSAITAKAGSTLEWW